MGALEWLCFLGTCVLERVVFNGMLMLDGHVAALDKERTG